MENFDFDSKYFDPEQTLDCGQIFRFKPFKDGYFVISLDKACYIKKEGAKTKVECEDGEYFYNFFDLDRDYKGIVESAKKSGFPLLARSAEKLKGLRLLNQNREETIYSFIVSQNNNIPRIKGVISMICEGLSEKRSFLGEEFYPFPSSEKLAAAGREFFKNCGCGYRDEYLEKTSQSILETGISHLENLDGASLVRELKRYKGIGQKVADCIALFGFSKRDHFPVDTWIERIYSEDFSGAPASHEKITEYFTSLFKENSGYFQQYLFYGKRLNL